MKNKSVSSDSPVPGRSCNLIKKSHKEKCYGNEQREHGAA